jgi:hypothetical protein
VDGELCGDRCTESRAPLVAPQSDREAKSFIRVPISVESTMSDLRRSAAWRRRR